MSAPVVIGFRGHHVAVQTDADWIIRWIRAGFHHLKASGTSETRDQLEIREVGSRYHVLRNGDSLHDHADIDEAARRLRHEIIDCFVAQHSDLLWLHAGAAANEQGAVLFVGRFGHGKSTLVTRLCARGWTYISDDIVPLDVSSGHLLPFPLTPVVRQALGRELPRERVPEIRKTKVDLPDAAFHRAPASVAGLVFPRFRQGSPASLEDPSPGGTTLDLLREAINKERDRAATVALCARMVNDRPVLRIGFSSGDAAADLIESHFSPATTSRRCG